MTIKKEGESGNENLPNLEAVNSVLQRSYEVIQEIGVEGAEIIEEGVGFGDLERDTTIAADKRVGVVAMLTIKQLVDYRPTKIVVEGLEDVITSSGEIKQSWYIDPLDASLNLMKKLEDPSRQSTLGLPYSTSISVFKGENHSYSECISAGVIDLRSGDTWLAEKGKGAFLNGRQAQTSGATKLNISEGIVIGEFYYPENRELLVKIFKDQKGWLRNPGSAAYEMALIASGHIDAYICDRQKSHELGTTYRLVTEAGGFVCDFEGNELGDRDYEFNSQVPVIVAATKELAFDIIQRINKVK